MAVSVRGRVHKLRVRPGPDGKEDFKRQVRALLGYDDSMEFDVIFECKTPHSGEQHRLASCPHAVDARRAYAHGCYTAMIIYQRAEVDVAAAGITFTDCCWVTAIPSCTVT